MIGVIFVAALAIVYRMANHLFTKMETVVLLVFIAHLVMVWLQISICDHRAFPEKRYWVQAGILLSGWAVWGVDRVSQKLSKTIRVARFALPAIVVGFAIAELGLLTKAQVPGTRRNAYVAACDWAVQKIAADWRGGACDETNLYSDGEYHQPNRPCVYAHTARVPYLLGGRLEAMANFGAADLPDYICDVKGEESLECYGPTRYEQMDGRTFGKYDFVLYRRVVR